MKGWVCPACRLNSPAPGHCPNCARSRRYVKLMLAEGIPVPLVNVSAQDALRVSVPGFPSIDDAMSGGFVAGSVTMLYGGPGCGKSRLTLKLSHRTSLTGHRVLYVSSEQLPWHVKMTAGLVGASESKMLVSFTTSLEELGTVIENANPTFLIVDSVSGVGAPLVEATQFVVDLVRHSNAAALAVYHVNNDGDYSGPQAVEHLVDAAVELYRYVPPEGVTVTGPPRICWTVARKYRFGPVGRTALIEETEEGDLYDAKVRPESGSVQRADERGSSEPS